MDLLSMIIESRNRFTPLSLSPALWLSDTGSDPAVWEDLSGNGRNATQGTALNQPAIISNGLNGRQVRRFDGTNDFLNLGVFNSFLSGGEFSIYTVAKPTGSLGTTYRSYIGTSNDQPSLYYRTNTKFGFYYGGPRDFSTTLSQNTPYILGIKRSGSVWNGYVNGVIEPISQTNGGTWGTGSVYIGRESVSYYAQDIAEILIFRTALSDTDRQRVEAYLSSKWGIPTYDSDALDYFTRVEAAGSTINADNKNAINQFIVGCKADGNWTSIKASCILAGADTLSGALVPLVGTAPTNVGFLSGDYSPTSGLQGNLTGKYLVANRNHNADPQNSCHAFVYITSPASLTNDRGYIGTSTYSNSSRLIQTQGSGTGFLANGIITRPIFSPTGGLGVSRTSSTNINTLINRSVISSTYTSSAPISEGISVFRRTQTNDARLSFYSLGESINLALLDTRLTQLMNSLRSSSYDADALAYFARIEAAGSTINESNRNAVNEFIIGCKADGNWSKIKASCILAGADTLSGALQPLVGTAPTPFFFEESNYSRIDGLISNGTTSYLNSNRNDSADTKDNASMCLCITQHSSENFYYASYTNFNGSAGRVLSRNGPSGVGAMCNNGGGSATVPHSRTTATLPAFVGISRSNPTDYSFRYGGVTDTVIKTSGDPQAGPIHIFKQGNNTAVTSYSDVRLSFYSIGESINLDLLDTRITKLMNSLI